jgi:hypothetical protein
VIHWLEAAAWACATCTDPKDPRNAVYLDMTMFMSLLPLTAMGLVIGWLYWRSLALESTTEVGRRR